MYKCEMCGKEAVTFYTKWYQYDNGEQVRSEVCSECLAVHTNSLLKTGDN